MRCRGPAGAGQLAAAHTIRQTFVLAVVRSQIKVFGRGRGGSTQSRPGAIVVVRHGDSPQIPFLTSGGLGFNVQCPQRDEVNEPVTCEAEAPTPVMGDCEFTERVVSTETPVVTAATV